jgi:hypothetical protein
VLKIETVEVITSAMEKFGWKADEISRYVKVGGISINRGQYAGLLCISIG